MNDSRRHDAMRQAAAGRLLDCRECIEDLRLARDGDVDAQQRMKARGWTAVDMILHGIERIMDQGEGKAT
jgi:hypothetical protein